MKSAIFALSAAVIANGNPISTCSTTQRLYGCCDLGGVGDACHPICSLFGESGNCVATLSCDLDYAKCYNSPRLEGQPCVSEACGAGLTCSLTTQLCEYTGRRRAEAEAAGTIASSSSQAIQDRRRVEAGNSISQTIRGRRRAEVEAGRTGVISDFRAEEGRPSDFGRRLESDTAGVNQPCDSTADCKSDLQCVAGLNQCKPYGKVGQICYPAKDCASGLVCKQSRCVNYVGEGEACGGYVQCDTSSNADLKCTGSVCLVITGPTPQPTVAPSVTPTSFPSQSPTTSDPSQ